MSKIRTYLKTTGQSIGSFASDLKMSQSYMSEIIAFKKTPTLQLAYDIAVKTGGIIPMTYWIEGDTPVQGDGSEVSPAAIDTATPV